MGNSCSDMWECAEGALPRIKYTISTPKQGEAGERRCEVIY
jgi:hypothetical protein